MKFLSRSFLSISTLLFLSGTGLSEVELVPGLSATAVSGYIGEDQVSKGEASDSHAVHYLSAGERFDQPCYLRIYKADMNHQEDSTASTWNQCTTTSANKVVGWYSDSDIKVRGIQVCSNNRSNHRMKGVRLYGARVNSNGSLTLQTGYKEFKRANCKRWHSAVFCKADEVAVKVVIHSDDDEITGLGLKCRKVTDS